MMLTAGKRGGQSELKYTQTSPTGSTYSVEIG